MIKPIQTLRPTRANAGIEAWYRRQLNNAITEMQKSLMYWLQAEYKKTGIAQDQDPSRRMQIAIKYLSRKWLKHFDDLSLMLANKFVEKNQKHTDFSLYTAFRDMGFTVNLTMTDSMATAFNATRSEQVNLIRTIPQHHINRVESLVNESVARGRDLGYLTKALQQEFGVTKKRAALIARDQNNKATTVLQATRQMDLGITHGIWRHSHAGKVPRPSHVNADGQKFEIAKGLFLDGEWVRPAEAINCLPYESNVEITNGCKRLFRHWYSGKLSFVVTSSNKRIESTPNHPILTNRGWKAIKDVNVGDYIVEVGDNIIGSINADIKASVTKIGKLFDTAAFYIPRHRAALAGFEFHGDITNSEVDIIDMAGFLPNEVSSDFCEVFCELFFSESEKIVSDYNLSIDGGLYSALNILLRSSEREISVLSSLLPFLKSHPLEAKGICLRLSSNLNIVFNKDFSDKSSTYTEMFRGTQLAKSADVIANDFIIGEIFSMITNRGITTIGSQEFKNNDIPHADDLGNFINSNTGIVKLSRVSESGVSGLDFSGHVYNLETFKNWFTVENHIIHNCRCFYTPIVQGFE